MLNFALYKPTLHHLGENIYVDNDLLFQLTSTKAELQLTDEELFRKVQNVNSSLQEEVIAQSFEVSLYLCFQRK